MPAPRHGMLEGAGVPRRGVPMGNAKVQLEAAAPACCERGGPHGGPQKCLLVLERT